MTLYNIIATNDDVLRIDFESRLVNDNIPFNINRESIQEMYQL